MVRLEAEPLFYVRVDTYNKGGSRFVASWRDEGRGRGVRYAWSYTNWSHLRGLHDGPHNIVKPVGGGGGVTQDLERPTFF